MPESDWAEPNVKDSSAKRLLFEIRNAYSDEKLIAYWKGRLDPEESEILHAEVLRNTELRDRLTKIAERLFEEFPDELAALMSRKQGL